jgi:hypothetical protein
MRLAHAWFSRRLENFTSKAQPSNLSNVRSDAKQREWRKALDLASTLLVSHAMLVGHANFGTTLKFPFGLLWDQAIDVENILIRLLTVQQM